jgi:hypothetical protein
LLHTHKIEALRLWNTEYPKKLFYTQPAFESYLESLHDPSHVLLLNDDKAVMAWYFDFIRNEERWFGMIVSSKYQGEGLGTMLLDLAKSKRTKLNGWVIDHEQETRYNGKPYLSPLSFYLKKWI